MEGLITIHRTFHGIDWLNQIFKFITMLGDIGFIWFVIAFILLFFKKTRKGAIIMIVSLGVGYIFNKLYQLSEKYAIILELPEGTSFPSGHAFSSFLCATLLCLYNKKLGFITFPLAFLIALSRVYLCVHYPTDVLAGALIGVLFAVNVYFIGNFIIRKINSKKRQSARENVQDK